MLIFAACLAVFVYGMVASMLGTINPGLAERFQLDNVQTGYMALAQGVGLTIASVSVGPLIDRRGKKVGLLLGLGLVGAAMLGLANATGYLTILAAMLVMGVGGGAAMATLMLALRLLPGVVVFPVRASANIALTAALAFVLWREQVTPRQWLGVALAVAAVYLLV